VIWETNRGVLGHTKEWKNPFLHSSTPSPHKFKQKFIAQHFLYECSVIFGLGNGGNCAHVAIQNPSKFGTQKTHKPSLGNEHLWGNFLSCERTQNNQREDKIGRTRGQLTNPLEDKASSAPTATVLATNFFCSTYAQTN